VAERTLYVRPANKPFNTNTAQRTTPMDKPSIATSPNAARGPLTQEEWEECQRNGLCMGCGKKDHIVRDCLLRKVMGRATYTIDGEEIIEDYYEVEEEEEQENEWAIQSLPGEFWIALQRHPQQFSTPYP